MADRIRWHETAIEVHALHLRICRQYLQRSAYWLNRGGVVSRADHDPRSSRETLSDASDERMLTAIGHCARIQGRRCDRANRVRAILPTRAGEQIRGSAPLCRVGRSNEPAKAGGAAVIGRASGFLETEACTTRDLAARLVVTLAQTSLRKPSRAKQEPDDLTVRPLGGQE
jgi:hypothetical protein